MSDRILSFILAMGLACLSLTAAEESAYEAGNGAPADFALGTEPWFITPVPEGEQAVVEALEFSYMSNTILRATLLPAGRASLTQRPKTFTRR